MKKLIFILFAFLIVSCSTFSPIVSFVDYSAYNRAGIFLTEANSVNFNYEPIGSINVLLYSGMTNEVKTVAIDEKKEKVDDIYSSSNSGKFKYKDATIQEALKLAVEKAKNMGGNAVLNIRYEYIPAYKNNPPGWHMSGMVVKK